MNASMEDSHPDPDHPPSQSHDPGQIIPQRKRKRAESSQTVAHVRNPSLRPPLGYNLKGAYATATITTATSKDSTVARTTVDIPLASASTGCSRDEQPTAIRTTGMGSYTLATSFSLINCCQLAITVQATSAFLFPLSQVLRGHRCLFHLLSFPFILSHSLCYFRLL